EEGLPIALPATLLFLVIFGLLGWRWTFAWRRESMPAALAAFWVPLPYVLGHAESLWGPRLPLDGGLLCYTAFGLAWLVPGMGMYPGVFVAVDGQVPLRGRHARSPGPAVRHADG